MNPGATGGTGRCAAPLVHGVCGRNSGSFPVWLLWFPRLLFQALARCRESWGRFDLSRGPHARSTAVALSDRARMTE